MRECELKDEISITWHIDDVLERRDDLTPEQCRMVLQRIADNHDAEIGVNWDVIDCVAEVLFPESQSNESDTSE